MTSASQHRSSQRDKVHSGSGCSSDSASSDSSSSGDSPLSSPTTPPSLSPSLYPDDCISVSDGDRDLLHQLTPSPFYPITLSLLPSPSFTPDPVPLLPKTYVPLPLDITPREVDTKDIGTPDEWIMRDKRLVRLTGRWPFNCEAPLTDLFNAGFLTPQSLFYVRNHGVVPRVSLYEAQSWVLIISGLVSNPLSLSLLDLQDRTRFRTITLPVTLVCAGNRRKEQNAVRQSLGFSWGAAGVSTALWTGVYLADVLAAACPTVWKGENGERKAPKYVVFEGAEDLPDGKYGTSQKLSWAMRKDKGMMLAWAMNGQPLEPDHGYPLRVIIPGQIGGRSVKWLKKIEVSDRESQHHLHFFDNKVLPMTLTADQAKQEKHWWYDPRYIITDLNVNSAVALPAHDETLTVSQLTTSASVSEIIQKYIIQGYAYAGGGRQITRVEVTLDGGRTWRLAEIKYLEDTFRNGEVFEADVWGSLVLPEHDEYFCWVFWRYEVEVRELVECANVSGCVAVRAMDEALCLQPEGMYWNPTGMMNNCWFRVAIHISVCEGQTTLRFEHPTMPGTIPGGWMERLKNQGQDNSRPTFVTNDRSSHSEPNPSTHNASNGSSTEEIPMTQPNVSRKITLAELEEQGGANQPWFVMNGEVYDATPFLNQHPGGVDSIMIVAGQDATEDFMAIHSLDARRQLAEFHIGTLTGSTETTLSTSNTTTPDFSTETSSPQFLLSRKWKTATLRSIAKVNHDSCIFKFELDHPEQVFGVPCGKHVFARLRKKSNGDAIGGELVQRAYTPVSAADFRGFVELLVKIYRPCPEFPNGGKMTSSFEALEVGDQVGFKGPLGSFEWLGGGIARWRGVERQVRNVGLICGGSGITPIMQVLRGILTDPSDPGTHVWIIDANKTEEDILYRDELENLVSTFGRGRIQMHHILSNASQSWTGSRGRIDTDALKEHMPSPQNDALILVCGPDPMITLSVKPGLKAIGWDIDESLVVF